MIVQVALPLTMAVNSAHITDCQAGFSVFELDEAGGNQAG